MNIITALKNPKTNKKLKEETNFNVIGNDIQYQDGIKEMLEKNREIDLAIISELLPGECEFKELINKIKNINSKIEIIAILKEKNEKLKNYLIEKGIFNIFYNNEITIDQLIKIINEKNNIKKENEINREIEKLKEIILQKKENKNNLKIFYNNKIINIKNKLNNFINKNKKIKNKKNKIISIVGSGGVGKSSFCSIFAKTLKNPKILIIDFDILNSSINSIFGTKKYIKKIKEKDNIKLNLKNNNQKIKVDKNIDIMDGANFVKNEGQKHLKEDFSNKLQELSSRYNLIIIDNSSEYFCGYTKEVLEESNLILFLLEPNLIELKKSRNLLDIYINKWKIKKEKINIIFNKININSIDNKILKNLFSDFNILGKIKINNNYNLIINKNIKIINKKIKKDYLEIIKKLNLN